MKASPKPRTIKEYQKYLLDLYGAKNKEREIDYLYGYLSRSVAYLGKNLAIRRLHNEHFFRSLSWVFAIANFYEIDLQESIYSRFPNICPYCINSPCICFRTNKLPGEYIPAYKAKEELYLKYQVFLESNHDYSLNKAIGALYSIYPNNEIVWHYAGPWHLIAKMQEEVGELHEAISKFTSEQKPKSAISEELSDTLAWLLSVWGIVSRERSIDDAFIDYYIDDCPVCRSLPCICTERADRAAELIDQRVLEEILTHLQQLAETLPSARDSLQTLQRSVAAAKKDQSEPTTVHALKETKGTLEKIRSKVSAADEIGRKSLSIIDTVTQLVDKIPWM